MNVTYTHVNPETGEETRFYCYRNPHGGLSIRELPRAPDTPLQLLARLRFAEAAKHARGARFTGPIPPAAEAIEAFNRGPVAPIVPRMDREGDLQRRYRALLGHDLPGIEEMVLGAPNVRTRAEETLADRRRGRLGAPVPEAQAPAPRLPVVPRRSFPRPL